MPGSESSRRTFEMSSKAAAEFTRHELEMNGRVMVIGPDLMEAFLTIPALQNAAAAGSDQALRNGEIGRVFGFRVFISPFVNGTTAFTRDAFALACRAPRVSEGAGKSASQRHNGYSLRVVQDFDMTVRAEVSLMSTFVGAGVLDNRQSMSFGLAA
nr:P22 phage major capsid protein family protein [Nocardiopsis sp. CNR-923]